MDIIKKNKMRICILLECFPPAIGGMESKGKLLCEELTNSGFKVIVVTRKLENTYLSEEELFGCRVYRTSPVGKGEFKRWQFIITSFLLLLRLRKEYDSIYVLGFRTVGVSAICIGKLFNKKVLLEAVSNGEFSGEFFKPGVEKLNLKLNSFPVKTILFIRNYFLKKGDIFLAISQQIKEELIAGGVEKYKIEYIPNFISTKEFYPANGRERKLYRKNLNLPCGKKILIYTGRIVSYKGLPLLLSVFKEINEQNKNVILLLIGEGGHDIHNCEELLKNFIQKNTLEEFILLMGKKTNINEYLKASDIFVFPTEEEAFGISLIEAMASGLPVISTPIGEIDYYLVDKNNGLKIPPNDHHSLKVAIRDLLHDEKLCNYLSKNALRTVEENYSNYIVMKKFIEVYKSVLSIEDISNEVKTDIMKYLKTT